MPEQKPRRALWWVFFLLLLLLLLAGAAAVVGIRWMERNEVSRILPLPDGTTASVAGVDFGTNHVLGSPLLRRVARMPLFVQGTLKKLFGSRAVPAQTLVTPTPTLVVWLDLPKPPSTMPYVPPAGWYEAYLADANGFVSGGSQTFNPGFGMTTFLQFSAFPRRDRSFAMHVFYHDAQGKVKDCGRFGITNPEYRSYPQWQPETLPVTKHAGDVEATLKELKTGQGQGMTYSTLAGGGHAVEFPKGPYGGANATAVRLALRSLSDTNQVWQVDHVELSDATGNVQPSKNMTGGSAGDDVFGFSPGLWTNEAAWKLRCEIRRNKGFAPGELITFRNVPLPAMRQTNLPGWSTNINGVTVTLSQIIREPPLGDRNAGWSANQLTAAKFVISGAPKDFDLELLEARGDSGTNVAPMVWSSGDTTKEYDLNVPLNVNSLDFTLAAQQGRWVEFMVKPETGKARFEFPAPGKTKAD